ncbi:Holliday junction resolvase RuvX [Desulfobaculum bizertense]|uniref:Putative pre-16S rRNA nuclease n=1 Tax=Desulfobaculum bizertense DSM 18034 TaxID=1121442 RepID=A0A1T4VWZ9_9BACT|nr:Holliday junction resolvase RuvX [Desulfobaculum bizertense]UIJ36848.1 Holliday junction resolvase RuvX [Desulfobaculum bizertense]SKA69526.1 putative holliday junction resolvase [Desulfobaculum bizertense DSM 18034]
MRILGIDFGLKRVGLAMTDGLGTMAFPYKTLVRSTRDILFQELLEILEKENVEYIVIGLPLSMDGTDSLTTRQARNFAASLGRRTEIPISMMDERLSSEAAKHDLLDAGLHGRKKIKKVLDQHAAVHILESYLAQEKGQC